MDTIKIKINDIMVNFYGFDTHATVLERYSVSEKNVDSFLPILPQFLRFTNIDENDNFEKNGEYEVENLGGKLKTMSVKELVANINDYKNNYPLLNNKTIVYAWIIASGQLDMSIDDFTRYYKDQSDYLYEADSSFLNARIMYISAKKYKTELDQAYQRTKNRIADEADIFKTLMNLNPVNTEDFVIEGTIEETHLIFDLATPLAVIFDNLIATDIIPFIAYSNGDTFIYKVYKDIIPLQNWLSITHKEDNTPFIYFYVTDTKNKATIEEIMYREGHWSTDHIIKIDARGIVTYFNDVLDQLKNSNVGNFKIIHENFNSETKGKFGIPNQHFNKAVYIDMISNNHIFSHFFMLDEQRKSSLEKKRFVYYYKFREYVNASNSLTITMTDSPILVKTDVRVSRAKSNKQIEQFILLFSYLTSLYNKNYQNIVNYYKKLYATINFQIYERKNIKAISDIKTGKRLKILETHNENVFKKHGYSSKCQPKRRQPYVITNDKDLDKLKQTLRDVTRKDLGKEFEKLTDQEIKSLGEKLSKHGLLNWPTGSNDWYACYPREEDDDQKRHIWPGIIKHEDFEAPCCFITDQFSKKGTKIAQTVELKDDGDAFDRPLGSNKLTPPGRYAELPYYLQIAALSAGYKTIEYKKKIFLPILRHGVMFGPDSFVHCMEASINHKYYSKLSIEEKKIRVRKIINDITDELLVAGKQQLYDEDYEKIKKDLQNPNTFIDPDIYATIFAKYYDCNILVYKVDSEHQKGEVSLPRYSRIYLPNKFNPKGETVIIVKFQYDLKYQCELLIEYESDNKIQYCFNESNLFAKNSFEILNKVNNVYTVTLDPPSSIKYVPQIIF